MRRHHGRVSARDQELVHLQRVALVAGNYVNVADGVAKTLHRIVDALQRRGAEVYVLAPRGEHPALSPADELIPVPSVGLPIQKGYRLSMGLHGDARRSLEQFDPQLIHVATPDPTGLMAVRYARSRQLALTSTYHTNFATYLKYWGRFPSALTPLAWSLTRRFYGLFDAVYVPTASLGEELVERGILPHYSVLARGIDRNRFHPQNRCMDWRRDHGLAPDDRVVLFCARIVWEKGLRTLVEALRRMKEADQTFRCVVAGDGAQAGWLRKRLTDAVFTGYLDHDDLACVYASSDLFVYPSTTDTFGNVTLEAMASGLPVVGARAPGTRTLVEHGESGILVAPDDPGELADATLELLADDARRRRLARGAQRRARQFHWSDILHRFTADLDRIAGAST